MVGRVITTLEDPVIISSKISFRFSFHIKKLKLQSVDHVLRMWFSLKATKIAVS